MKFRTGTERLLVADNRIQKFEDGTLEGYTYGSANQILTAGSDSFTFDNFLNMKTKVSGGNTTTYGWDFENNLVSIDYPGTSNDDSHEYDGQSRRMRSKLAGAANWTHFIWDEVAGMLLAEYTLISSTYTIKSENTWGLGLISTNRESTKRYFHFDGTGNSIALTDSSENITDTYGYTSSGVPVSSLDSGTSVNPFRWLGERGAYDDGAMGSAASFVVIGRLMVSSQLVLSLQILPLPTPAQVDWLRRCLKCVQQAIDVINRLMNKRKDLYPGPINGRQNLENAVGHCAVSCTICRACPDCFSVWMGREVPLLYGIGGPIYSEESKADIHNNNVGCSFAKNRKSTCLDQCYKAALEGKLSWFI